MEQVERENRKQSNKQHIANMQAALVHASYTRRKNNHVAELVRLHLPAARPPSV